MGRTPRACEHCRQTRRRCEPPYPCRQCVAAGISCNVRAKARPQRRQQHRRTISMPRNVSHEIESGSNDVLNGEPTGHNHMPPVFEEQQCCHTSHNHHETQSDTFELVKTLVRDLLLKRHDYALNCALVEPSLYDSKTAGSPFLILAQADACPPLPPSAVQIWDLLTKFQSFTGWHDSGLVNIEDLHAIVRTLTEHLSDLSLSSVSTIVTSYCLSVDSVALMFVALALGAVATGDIGHGRFYFNISTEMVKYFVGQSTLNLCLAFFLQHVFALRIGTLSYAHGIIVQAIQSAHDLRLHHNTHGIQGLQLYLLIYMADQYCSLTHNTEAIIGTSKLQDKMFAPLSDAKPQLQTLIDLVTINGYVIEHTQRLPNPSQGDIVELESKIGSLCSRLAGPIPVRPSCGGFRTAYEPLARVHMLCCRLKLRVPGLSDQGSWLPSLCICVHAAEGVLSTYFQLYRPVLAALVGQGNTQTVYADKSSMPVASKLATTWRQVKRIMMSAFIIVFAYWHGEMVHEEASRFIAMARLLLEYPRWRWGEKLDEALQTLIDISSISDFRLYDHTQLLLPGADEQCLQSLSDLQHIGLGPREAIRNCTANRMGTCDEVFSAFAPWQDEFDAFPIDGIFGSDTDIFQIQPLLSLP